MSAVAKYEFPDQESAEVAATKIRNELGHNSAWYSGNQVVIESDCRDFSRAASIAKAYGGKARN